jgi:hypothetical protein
MALSWWINSTKGDLDMELRGAIEDVKWVFSELVAATSAANSETGQKRDREFEEESQEESNAKK